jgi:signal transduction histidine kinase
LARKLLVLNLTMRNQPTENLIAKTQPVPAGVRQIHAGRVNGRRGPTQGDAGREARAAERLDAAIRLAAWVAHNINNPLGAVCGNAQLLGRRLQRDITNPETLQAYMKYVDGIQGQAERCARIIAEMLSFSRHGEPEMRVIDVRGVIREAAELVRFAHPGVRIKVVAGESEDLSPVRADREWLMRVLFEILSNAVEASGAEPVRTGAQMVCRGGKHASQVQLTVEDSGPGIPDGVLPRIFDPFFSTREGSLGLGLTLALEMVRKMGGSLRVVDGEVPGCRFVVTFPAQERRDHGG